VPIFFLFIAMPLLELATILWVHGLIASYWGAFNAFLFAVVTVIGTGVGGAALARSQGMIVIQKLREASSRGEVPGTALLDGALILLGGILLLTPGYITDLFGFCCLFPVSRTLLRIKLVKWFEKQVMQGRVVFQNFSFNQGFGGHQPGRPQQYEQRHDQHQIVDVTPKDRSDSPR
jgi:UPF0716 protein FxsA